MNNKSIEAIKSDLISLLDNVNNVVGCQKAMDAIAKLEGCVMTKDILEQTRIGKYVNELRKKTTDKNLSRRIKNLVRKWQEVVNNAGIDLNQPFKRVAGAVNGKHNVSIASPSLSHINGKVNNGGAAKLIEHNSLMRNTSSVTFTVSSPSPVLLDASRSLQNTPLQQWSATASPLVNNSQSDFVAASSLTKSKLTVINGHSNHKIPTTPNFPSCDNKKTAASTQLAGKKRKSELPISESPNGLVNKKSKSSPLIDPLNNNRFIKSKLEKTLPQELNDKAVGNEDANGGRSVQHQPIQLQNGFMNGGSSFEDKLFSCNSTGNLKCTISRAKLIHTPPSLPPPSFPSTIRAQTPLIKHKSLTPSLTPSSLSTSFSKSMSSSISAKVSNTPPMQSSIKLKYANTPPINATHASQTPHHKPLKKSATASTPLHENYKPLVKHSKVETTAQILQKLHSNSDLSESLEKISSSRIRREKSDDEEAVSVVPASIKARSHSNKRKSRLVPPKSNAQEVARAKDERMQIFLHSSIPPPPAAAAAVCNEESKKKTFNNVKSKDFSGNKHAANNKNNVIKPSDAPKKEEEEEEEVDVTKLDPNSAKYRAALLKNPWAFLPPITDLLIKSEGGDDGGGVNAAAENGGGGVKGGGKGDGGEGVRGGEEGGIEDRLNKLSLQQWPGVNGLQDANGEWKDWTKSFSVKVNDQYCHILPYVCL